MKAAVFWGLAVVVLLAISGLILHKEHVLRTGRPVLLRLAPRDPRSLIQGDYMVLRYRLATGDAARAVREGPADGRLVITMDENAVAQFKRLHHQEPLAEGEFLLRYRRRGEGEIRLGAESFFFQEGHARYYENARYGELRVAPSGQSVLVGLRGEAFERLGPPSDEE